MFSKKKQVVIFREMPKSFVARIENKDIFWRKTGLPFDLFETVCLKSNNFATYEVLSFFRTA